MRPLLVETIATATAMMLPPITLIHTKGRGSSCRQNVDTTAATARNNRPAAMSTCTDGATASPVSCPRCPTSHRAQIGFINRLRHGLILLQVLAMAVPGENYNAATSGSNFGFGTSGPIVVTIGATNEAPEWLVSSKTVFAYGLNGRRECDTRVRIIGYVVNARPYIFSGVPENLRKCHFSTISRIWCEDL